MRLECISSVFHVYPSDTLRHHQIPAGMAELRHKSRHNFWLIDVPRFKEVGIAPG